MFSIQQFARCIHVLIIIILVYTSSAYIVEAVDPGLTEVEQAIQWRHRDPLSQTDVEDYKWDAYIRDVPEWYQDAKFGVYAHWGPYNQGMQGSGYTGVNNSWFAKYMYVKGHPYYQYHVETRGPLNEKGYSHYFRTFTAPNFDPVEWADLIAGSGARFAGPVAMHHDGFCHVG